MSEHGFDFHFGVIARAGYANRWTEKI